VLFRVIGNGYRPEFLPNYSSLGPEYSMPDSLPLEVDCQTVKALQDAKETFLLLDCRREDEYQTASIPGAILIPMDQLAARSGELAPYREGRIVVHCHHGGRSLRVAQWLRQQGFSQAQSMAGGIDAWSELIDPKVPRY
jgi:rhodanese-related sulfurtransferase